MFKRAKQLEHWNESDTCRASVEPRTSSKLHRVHGRRQIQGGLSSNLNFRRRLFVAARLRVVIQINPEFLLGNFLYSAAVVHVRTCTPHEHVKAPR